MENVFKFIYDTIKGLEIEKCDIYLNRPTIFGDNEKRKKSYVTISIPNGIENMGSFAQASGIITIGAKDAVLGLPQVNEILRVAEIIKNTFPVLTEDYSLIDFEFASDDSLGNGWHEYYYSFQIYINKSF
jgi:hypothetical protein